MNSVKIEENVKGLVKQISSQEISKTEFVYELLLAYGHRKSVVNRVKSGERNLAKTAGEVILKRHLYFKPCTSNLFAEIDALKNNKAVATNKIRFVVVTDFSQLIAIDTKTQDTLDIELGQLAKHFDFFLPWAGMEKMVYRGENPADVKAAEKMADFFDHIKSINYSANATKEQLHEVVLFLNRLLFCLFAEDTKIFKHEPYQFTNVITRTNVDGSDVHLALKRLFEVLNTPAESRPDLPDYLSKFPYVNGGLFKKEIAIPTFDFKARKMLLDAGELDWSDINPDIFGSMIQGVAEPETRSKMGMHYTSVSNIMKVIEPLFLNDLYEEFDKCNDNLNKLKKLQVRLSRIKFFDPACGSGNFLIITYKEIRLLEIEILKRISELEKQLTNSSIGQNYTVDVFGESLSAIHLDQFYGIEFDDFAHEMAILSLWLVEHQMNMVFETEFGYTAPTLPLKQSGRIFAGNAARIDWDLVCPIADDEVYVLGNPPYLGARNQDKQQKSDVYTCYNGAKEHKDADYISCWFIKASKYISQSNGKFAFVSTNSVCQGDHVSILWPLIFNNEQEIFFAYESFKWTNNAKSNAGVTCVIIGIRNISREKKSLYSAKEFREVNNINGYLTSSSNVLVSKRTDGLTRRPKMVMGSQARDGGNLILSVEEKDEIVSLYPESEVLFKKLVGSDEFIKGNVRWCLWIEDNQKELAELIPPINLRIKNTFEFRLASKAKTTNGYASIPHKFAQRAHKNGSALLIPAVSSERRDYIPLGFVDDSVVISNRAFVIYEAPIYLFGLLTSKIHVAWIKAVSGRLETRINYSSGISYNTFPIPELSSVQKEKIEELVLSVLEVREEFPERTIAELYDPETMPKLLLDAHRSLDLYVDKCYRKQGFLNEDDALNFLFSLYESTLALGR
ncbi:class I SAM-dependent DNA methyltransferase [Providencia heimbachae]|uniref:DNA methyltransferase n=1 Tax=Providencia heimbachae TaxID=333962 RepID=UPI00141A60EF|nr:DNA methyltransferase [Providencia heimbachae]NIH21646.1 class I SAM-dependent DNA methyltransferase [Providencia heimbachae]